ncbi:hypothetical protein [Photobacterium iliopiscarium]|uniref:hypothetical protein n=1 Tax=Photobacterium iliopiscarium TaxID=56192 RepID=UPI000A9627FC|nr:hypothetical protein [Photobacterium iliopiscarium]
MRYISVPIVIAAILNLSIFNIAYADSIEYLNIHRVDLKGDQNINYPQVCIRVNRSANRIPIMEKFQEIRSESPNDNFDQFMGKVTKWADSGIVGHTWINLFYKDDNGEIKSKGYGFGSNGNQSFRKFSFQKCVNIQNKTHQEIENDIALKSSDLYKKSINIAKDFLNVGYDWAGGRYTMYTNCAWFGGKLFNAIVPKNEQISYSQPFDYSTIVPKSFPMSKYRDLPDPGYIAESISKVMSYSGWYSNYNIGYGALTNNTAVTVNRDGLTLQPRSLLAFYPQLTNYVKFIYSGYFSESENKMYLFTNGLANEKEFILTPFTSYLAIKPLDTKIKIIAAFHHPYDDKIGLVISNKGEIFTTNNWENTGKTALKPYVKDITSAANYFESGRIMILLRPDDKQTSANKSDGVRFIIYDYDQDKVITAPKLFEKESGFNFLKLQ